MGLKYSLNHIVNGCAVVQAFVVPFIEHRQSGVRVILESPRDFWSRL